MDLKNVHGQTVSWSTIGDDILKYHLSSDEIFRKRKLSFSDRDAFLSELKVIISNKTLFSRIRRGLVKNDELEEKKMARKIKSEPEAPLQQVSATDAPLAELIEIRAAMLAQITVEETSSKDLESILKIKSETVENAQAVFNKAKLALEEALENERDTKKKIKASNQRLKDLNSVLADTEKKIEEAKRAQIYLVAPGYSGDLPESGTFISTNEIDGISSLQIENVEESLEIKPDFQDMINAGFDSALEYARALKFISLASKYFCIGSSFELLCSDERVLKLYSKHIEK